MKFRLIIDPTKEKEVTAVVHARSSLTDRLELLLAESSELRKLPAYTEDEMQMLSILLLAFFAAGCTTIYQVERLSLGAAILFHGGLLYIGYAVTRNRVQKVNQKLPKVS